MSTKSKIIGANWPQSFSLKVDPYSKSEIISVQKRNWSNLTSCHQECEEIHVLYSKPRRIRPDYTFLCSASKLDETLTTMQPFTHYYIKHTQVNWRAALKFSCVWRFKPKLILGVRFQND